jgi:membrane protein YqaA with SNARE-associated domain
LIPIDALLAASISLKPQHRVKWVLWGVLGFSLGLGAVALLVNTHLQPYVFDFFNRRGYIDYLKEIVEHAQNYGYIELTIGVFTVLPSLFGVLIGVIVGLNPWIVWLLCMAGKVLKILVTVWLIFSGSQALKKYLRLWLKTSI